MERITFAVVEDDRHHSRLIRYSLEKAFPQATIHQFGDAETFLAALDDIRPQAVVTDYRLPGLSGLDLLRTLNEADFPVVMVTGLGDETLAAQALKLGAADYVVKTGEFHKLIPQVIEKSLRERETACALRENTRLRELLLDSLPHPTLMIRRDRTILAANRIARETGAVVGGLCPLTFGWSLTHPGVEPPETGSPDAPSHCPWCLSDRAFETGSPACLPELKALGKVWEVWWIPVDSEICLHYCIDITRYREKHLELQRERDFVENLIETAQAVILVLDTQGCIVRFNRYFTELCGYRLEEVQGLEWHDLCVDGARRDSVRQAFTHSISQNRITTGIHAVRSVSGEEHFIDWAARPLLDAEGGTLGFLAIGHDVTALRKSESARNAEERRFRNLVETMNDGLGIQNENGSIQYVNEKLCGMLRYSREELDGRPARELFDRASREAFEAGAKRCRNGEKDSFEAVMRSWDGRGIPVLVSMSPVQNGEAEFQGVLFAVKDITLRKNAEDAVRASNTFLTVCNRHTEIEPLLEDFVRELRRYVECTHAGIRLLSDGGELSCPGEDGFVCRYCNPGKPGSRVDGCICRNLVYGRLNLLIPFLTPSGSVFVNGASRFPGDDPYDHWKAVRGLCSRMGFESLALVPIRESGDVVGLIHVADERQGLLSPEKVATLENAAMALGMAVRRVRDAEALRWVNEELEARVEARTQALDGAARRLKAEVEERKEIERELRESSDKFKIFSYSVAHDLKSPSVGIYGIAQLLARRYADALDEKGKTFCRQILKGCEQIAGLVDLVNAYTEAKETPLQLEVVPVRELFAAVRQEFWEKINTGNVKWFEPDDVEVEFRADRLALMRIFRNLVGNALKHGGGGLSRISLGYHHTAGHHVLSVEDDGVGMSAAEAEKIFELFNRSKKSRGVEGVGLGMAIVRELAHRHGGTAWVKTEMHRGTTFFVSIGDNL